MTYQRIRELCAKSKLTIAQLERNCGLSNATIRRWETQAPSAISLGKVADYFGVSVDYLMGRCDLPDFPPKMLTEEAKSIAERYDALDPSKKRVANAYLNLVEAQ